MKCKLFYPQTDENAAKTFWEKLGGKGTVAAASPDEGANVSEAEQMAFKLYHISDASGSMVTTRIEDEVITREHLKTEDSYILELFDVIYVWQGHGATASEKRDGMGIAKAFIKEHNLNPKVKVCRLPEGIEDARFKSFFRGWYKPVVRDVGEDKTVHDNQDIQKLAQQEAKAKNMVLDKLGANPTKSLYLLEGDYTQFKLLGEGENMPKVLF
jgi:hypothetical protein